MHGKRMTVFLGERDHWNHRPLHLAILEHLKAKGCAGATVTRGIAGFGAHSHIRTSSLVELSVDLPIVVTVVDAAEKIDAFAHDVAGMLAGGAIVVDEVEVHFYSAAFQGGIPDVSVGDVMTRGPDFVTPETPVVAVVQTLLERDHTVLPVIDAERRVVGVVGDRDLLSAGVTSASLSLHKAADAETVNGLVRALATGGRTVREIMTAPAVTIREDERLERAARVLHDRRLKRLPVVDADGRLVGVLARLDVLASIARGYGLRSAPHGHGLPQEHRRVADFMETSVPTVNETTPLDEVVERLLASDVKRVAVVGEGGRLVGIVTDTDVLARVDPGERPGVFTRLRSRWSADAERRVRRAYGKRAADVMTSPPVVVRDDASVITALTVSATKHVKRLPVVDAAGRIVGIVSRPALLAASLDLAGDRSS
jgi:CBS domain-containing protein/PII-like signaling protein